MCSSSIWPWTNCVESERLTGKRAADPVRRPSVIVQMSNDDLELAQRRHGSDADCRVISSDGEEVRQARRVRVLVVDDEPEIHRVLRLALIACGYEPLKAMTGADALKIIAFAAPDVVILDLGLTDMDGKEVLRQTRIFSEAPIVILSARDDEAEKISALDAGANDYVEKPFAIGELLARVRAALRHTPCKEQQPPSRIEACGLVIDTSKHQVTKNGVGINLTPKEYDLLLVLARRPGGLVTHDEIWPGASGRPPVSAGVHRKIARKDRRRSDSAPHHQTELGVGYRFMESRTDSANE